MILLDFVYASSSKFSKFVFDTDALTVCLPVIDAGHNSSEVPPETRPALAGIFRV